MHKASSASSYPRSKGRLWYIQWPPQTRITMRDNLAPGPKPGARSSNEKKGLLMKNLSLLIAVAGVSASLVALAKADELRFTTLPPAVQTTVIKETRITSPSKVVRVVRDNGGVYAVTVMTDTGQQVVYVQPTGVIVQAPASTVQETTTTTTEVPEGVITTNVIQQYPSRFELLEKKGDKEIYLDHQTGRKIKVDKGKVERD
jgi:hypothetical protein